MHAPDPASSGESENRALRAWLVSGASHDDRPDSVEVIETHLSWVFLSRLYAYKLKKPLRFDFVDFSSLAARRAACENEVRLNRRLAPDTYLGVVPVVRDQAGGFHWGSEQDSEEKVVDWLVKMHRLPAQRFDTLLQAGAIGSAEVREVVQTLAAFQRRQPSLPIAPDAYLSTVEHHVRDNQQVLLKFAPELPASLIQRTHSAQFRALVLTPELFRSRAAGGRIVEGHGDLRPEHIYLLPKAIFVDCIEFGEAFRQLDVADEWCFLSMECEALGAGEIGRQLLAEGLNALADTVPTRLLNFYRAYRACVRAKVHALRWRQLADRSEAQADEVLRSARQYVELAESYAGAEAAPVLLVVGGLMGTGKSTVAQTLAERLGMELLQTDVVRRELLGASETPAGYGQGNYRPELRAQVYEELINRAQRLLRAGLSVIVDGTFSSPEARAAAVETGWRCGAEVLQVACHCPPEVARRRIATRLATETTLSEARPELFEAQWQEQSSQRPWAEVRVDTTRPLDTELKGIYAALARRLNF